MMFQCKVCKKTFAKWVGRCDQCNNWNCIDEVQNNTTRINSRRLSSKKNGWVESFEEVRPHRLDEIVQKANEETLLTGIEEFDSIMGNGLVNSQVLLLSGTPGIGKSTLVSQLVDCMSSKGRRVVYVCGEESPLQIKRRIDRLGLDHKQVDYVQQANLETLEVFLKQNDYDILVIDSIQTIYSHDIPSSLGSVNQITECTNRIVELAKIKGTITFIIGHVTKSGEIAGPKLLEHMVDTVLYFEGDKKFDVRILRVEKNRFGPTDEVGIFIMTEKGLIGSSNSANVFRVESNSTKVGSVMCMALEGNRPLLIEVQSLVVKNYSSHTKRTANGLDYNRFLILVAILEKFLKLRLWEFDIFVNITGGFKFNDPGIDLAVAKAILSSYNNEPVSHRSIFFGEVDLTGEVRKVSMYEKRLKESQKLGFDNVFDHRIKSITALKNSEVKKAEE